MNIIGFQFCQLVSMGKKKAVPLALPKTEEYKNKFYRPLSIYCSNDNLRWSRKDVLAPALSFIRWKE
jgi:hypothetical protein